MDSPVIRYTVYNPNSKEETVRFFVSLIADVLIACNDNILNQSEDKESD